MRTYTGNTDVSKNARPGTIRFQEWVCFLFQMRNLGIYANRNIRGSTKNVLSVHATGRAMDTGGTEKQCRELIDFLYKFRDRLLMEEIHDYRNVWVAGHGFGAGWRCDRDKGGALSGWKVYQKNTVGPGGLWVHSEIAPAMADNVRLVDESFESILNDIKKALEG